jgi:HD-GYP domain-containing protein (c-di-GMP phosphodiesterase class II)
MSEYALHLANLQEKTKIVATEDILSDQGVLLAKSGIELNKRVCENILRFKLLKPLEDSIAIENQLNAKTIYNSITQFIASDPWITAINNKLGDKVILQRCCLRLEKFPLLLQKLTVLNLEIPHIFEQALFSAYFAYLCGLLDKLSQSEIEEYFLAGIVHDIGFLHINHQILKKENDLTAEEWRAIQSHPVIGYEILKNISSFPKNVSRSVLEHHEKLDGSGYPRNKTAHELGSLGQLISLLDNTIAIYNKKIKIQQRSIRGVIPVLQVNIHSYYPTATSVIIRALKYAPEATVETVQIASISDLVCRIQEKQVYIKKATGIIQESNLEVGYEHASKEIFALQNIANNIIVIVNSTGLYDANYTDWLSSLTDDRDKAKFYNEIFDAQTILGEVIYLVQSYQKNANLFVTQNPSHTLGKIISQYLEQVKHIPPPMDNGPFVKMKLN